jgi:hypothetical protein
MSKEETLDKEVKSSGPYLTTDVVESGDALTAMDIWAQSQSIAFLDSIRDYERENGEQICYDERSSEDLYDIFIKNQLKQLAAQDT